MKRKGNQTIIYMVAFMVLAIMFIALWYTSMDGWLTGAGDQFINTIN